MNAGAIIRRTRNLFGDHVGAHLTDEAVYDWINDAQDEIVRQTSCLFVEDTISVAVGETDIQIEYDEGFVYAGEQFQLVNRVVWLPGSSTDGSTVLIPFEESGLDLYTHQSNPDTEQGTPRYYYIVGRILKIYPAPSIAGSISVSGIPFLADITDVADFPQIPRRYHKYLVDYCVWKASEMDNDAERTNNFRQNWDRSLALAIGQEENNSSYAFPRVSDSDSRYGAGNYGQGYEF